MTKKKINKKLFRERERVLYLFIGFINKVKKKKKKNTNSILNYVVDHF